MDNSSGNTVARQTCHSAMISIVADNKIPFLEGVFEPYAAVRFMEGRDIDRPAIRHADALLIRTRTRCDAGLLEGTDVRFIATATIGHDHIDTVYCDAHGIQWMNAPGCNASSVQQYIASALAALSTRHRFPLRGKTMGIIGVGHVGKKIESLAGLLGMNILLNDPPRARLEGDAGFISLEYLLRESDIVSLHVPLTMNGEDRTFRLINKATLKMMRKGAWLINTSRGEVMDETDLKAALAEKKLSGAVLDVWCNEPEPDVELMQMAAIATPHIAGYSVEGKKNGTTAVVRGLASHYGLPLSAWEPMKLPEPESPVIKVDCRDQNMETLVFRTMMHTYDITDDHLKLRRRPGDFEKIRSEYPPRREFPAHEVVLINPGQAARQLFSAFGFSVRTP
jgi:erythronate-4-phosphate dehydrogenase